LTYLSRENFLSLQWKRLAHKRSTTLFNPFLPFLILIGNFLGDDLEREPLRPTDHFEPGGLRPIPTAVRKGAIDPGCAMRHMTVCENEPVRRETAVVREFTFVDHTTRSWSQPALMLAGAFLRLFG
jgi:hypothetical protein